MTRPPLPSEAPAAPADDREATVVDVRLAGQTEPGGYQIHVGSGLIGELGRLYPGPSGGRGAIISATTVAGLYGETCRRALSEAGWEVEVLVVPDGEGAKTLQQAGELYERCLQAGLDRGSTIFALGGGVVGDLAGFVAATYMRGVPFVQVPTTLLAQVDASVGGKTAVDLPRGKNLVGAFHQPALVAIDVDTLATLPAREFAAGMAEVVKHAAIADAPLFEYLQRAGGSLQQQSTPASLRQIVARNCQIKAEIVAADPRERGVRAALNFGHTVGHAIEAAAGAWALRHGEALAFGLIAEARLAARVGVATPAVAAGLETVLRSLGLAAVLPPVDAAHATEALRHDKKIVNGRLRLPLVPRLGEYVLTEDIALSDVEAALAGVLSEARPGAAGCPQG